MYHLTKNHVRWGVGNRDAPILIYDTDTGPFDRNATLPFTSGSKASAFVERHLLKETLPTDPELAVDEGASLETYAWEYLTERTTRETKEFAAWYHRLRTKGIKLPELA